MKNSLDRSIQERLAFLSLGQHSKAVAQVTAAAGADVNIAADNSSLLQAAQAGDSKPAQLKELVSTGIDITPPAAGAKTMLRAAVFGGTGELADIFSRHGAASWRDGAASPRTPADEDTFLAMLKAGADPHVEIEQCDRLTPFQLAIKAGMVQVVGTCLERPDTDVFQKTADGRSLADLAKDSGGEMRNLIGAALAKAALAAPAAPAPSARP